MEIPSSTTFVIDFGKHRGTLITTVPTSYLEWMCSEGCRHRSEAVRELERRDMYVPRVGENIHPDPWAAYDYEDISYYDQF